MRLSTEAQAYEQAKAQQLLGLGMALPVRPAEFERPSLIEAVRAHYADRPQYPEDTTTHRQDYVDYDEEMVDWLNDLDDIVGQYL